MSLQKKVMVVDELLRNEVFVCKVCPEFKNVSWKKTLDHLQIQHAKNASEAKEYVSAKPKFRRSFSCMECHFRSYTKRGMADHWFNSHDGVLDCQELDKLMQSGCARCGFVADSISKLNRHKKHVHDYSTWAKHSCDKCKFSTDKVGFLRLHNMLKHDEPDPKILAGLKNIWRAPHTPVYYCGASKCPFFSPDLPAVQCHFIETHFVAERKVAHQNAIKDDFDSLIFVGSEEHVQLDDIDLSDLWDPEEIPNR